jgi:hypothetical protein
MTDTLKPCPLCGGEAQLEDYRDGGSNGYGVFCQTFTCQTCGPTTLNALDAINLWNTRPGEESAEKRAVIVHPHTVHDPRVCVPLVNRVDERGAAAPAAPNDQAVLAGEGG